MYAGTNANLFVIFKCCKLVSHPFIYSGTCLKSGGVGQDHVLYKAPLNIFLLNVALYLMQVINHTAMVVL